MFQTVEPAEEATTSVDPLQLTPMQPAPAPVVAVEAVESMEEVVVDLVAELEPSPLTSDQPAVHANKVSLQDFVE